MSKILIVEDENMLLEMMCAYLQAQGYETAGAKSYDDALNLAYESNFDLGYLTSKSLAAAALRSFGSCEAPAKTRLVFLRPR